MDKREVLISVRVDADELANFIAFLKEASLPWTEIVPVGSPKHWHVANDVYSLLKRGYSVRAIAKRLGISKSTVYRIGKDPAKYLVIGDPINQEIH